MATRVWGHLRTHFVGYLALAVALGGTAFAAGGHINGTAVRKNSLPGNRVKKKTLPGNRLKADSVTGKEMNESTLGEVPNAAAASTAASAATAASAEEAKDSDALGGVARAGFGQGIVSGSIIDVPNGAVEVTPYGQSDPTGESVPILAKAPVSMTIRDFVVLGAEGFTTPERTVRLALQVVDPNDAPIFTPLCQVDKAAFTCRVDGPIAIPQNSIYLLLAEGQNLPVSPSGVSVSFQYRAAAG